MTMSDPIADMICRLRNAQMVSKATVSMPFSKLKADVARVLKEQGYIQDFRRLADDKQQLEIDIKYYEGRPVIESIERVSRPGLRQYRGSVDLPRVLKGLGIAIISTSKGLMTDRQAREAGVGGEVICYVS
ncbi:MAG: 30S ribosomal protein S8 [Gammaproteobacteria bacterium]|nr:30S ribosomal protein S8 [Gammaproteobacteria bacterium]